MEWRKVIVVVVVVFHLISEGVGQGMTDGRDSIFLAWSWVLTLRKKEIQAIADSKSFAPPFFFLTTDVQRPSRLSYGRYFDFEREASQHIMVKTSHKKGNERTRLLRPQPQFHFV
jgi:hypothetical protein